MLYLGFAGYSMDIKSNDFGPLRGIHAMNDRIIKGTLPSPLTELAADYLASCEARGLMPKSLKQYRYSLASVFLPWCETEGVRSLADLDRRTVDRFTSMLLAHRTRSDQPLSRDSVCTYIRPIRLMLNWASREGEAVVAKPQLPRRERQVRDVLTRDEIDQLERAAVSERDQLIIRIFADCGLRLEELTRLQASDIVRGGRQAHLRVLGKRNRVRDVPLFPPVLRRLDNLIRRRPDERSSDAIFLAHRLTPYGEYEPLTSGGVYQVVKEAVAKAKITKRVYPHLLRHSWMTEMLRRGMNPVQLSIIAGASPEVIAACYTHLTKDDAYAAMMRALMPRGQR
jgi:integrase/recombinase XerD